MRMAPLFLQRAHKGLKNGHHMEGVPSKGRSDKRGMIEGGVSVEHTGLLESPGADGSSGVLG